MSQSMYAALITPVVAMLVHLAGLVVAIVLLIRAKGTAAILAVAGFALLTLISLGQIVLNLPAMDRWLKSSAPPWLGWPLNCCCGILDLAAVVCLIVALWQAISGAAPDKAVEEVEGEITSIG
jgi:hypothetical protein